MCPSGRIVSTGPDVGVAVGFGCGVCVGVDGGMGVFVDPEIGVVVGGTGVAVAGLVHRARAGHPST